MSPRTLLAFALALAVAVSPAAAVRADEGAGSSDDQQRSSAGPDADLGHAHAPKDDPDASEGPDADVGDASDPTAGRSHDSDKQVAPAGEPTAVTETPDVDPDAVPASKRDLPAPALCKDPTGDDAWAACLRDARAQLDRAQGELGRADAAYSRSITDGWPRGAEREKIVEAREIAAAHLEQAQQRLPELVEAARRAGVSPRVLDPYED
jgi:hypothetical protein